MITGHHKLGGAAKDWAINGEADATLAFGHSGLCRWRADRG